MNNKKPLEEREFKLTDDNGNFIGELGAISIVSEPAIELEYMLFENETPSINYFAATPITNEKMQITGPVMAANKKIIRKDPKTKEYYYTWFSEQTVTDCMKSYMKNSNNLQANTEHEDNYSRDFYVFESWQVVDTEQDKANALGFKEVNKGDWYVTYQVNNKETWEKIKKSEYTGFSIEVSGVVESEGYSLEKEIKRIVFDKNIDDEAKEAQIRDLLK